MGENKGLVRITLAIVMLTSFITPFMGNAINLAIPQIGTEFGGDQFWLNWVVTSYLLASAACLLPFGRLGDIVGRKRVFTMGIVLFALTSLGCGLAFSMLSLIIFRVLQGIAGAMVFGTAMAILTSVVPPKERGKAMGLSVAATYTGLSAGPVLGGLDIEEIVESISVQTKELTQMVRDDLSMNNLQDCDLRGVKVHHGKFDASALKGSDLSTADLAKSSYICSDLNDVRFNEADLCGATFNMSALENASFDGANLTGAKFIMSDLKGVRFDGADLSGVKFNMSSLNNASFKGSILDNAKFSTSDLSGVCFDNLTFNNAVFDKSSLTGTSFRNAVLRNVSFKVSFKTKKTIKKAIFDGATMDKLTYAVLKGYNADLTNVTVI